MSASGKKKGKQATDLEKRILKHYNPNILDSSSESEEEERASPEFKSPFTRGELAKKEETSAPMGRKTMEKESNPEKKGKDEKFGKKLEMPPNERYGQPRGGDPHDDEKKPLVGIITGGTSMTGTRTSAGPFFTFAPPASTFSSCKGSSVGAPAINESNVSSDRVEF